MPVVLRMAPAMPVMPCSRSTGLLTTVTDCGVCRIDSSMPVVACMAEALTSTVGRPPEEALPSFSSVSWARAGMAGKKAVARAAGLTALVPL